MYNKRIIGMPMYHYLVTGGAGFIGSHIVRELIARKKKVRVLDSLITGKKENLSELFQEVDILEGDARNLDTCRQAVSGVDCILHSGFALGSAVHS